MKNTPKRIYLQTCDDENCEECRTGDFNDLQDVTWAKDRVFKHDICYIRAGKNTLHLVYEIEKLKQQRLHLGKVLVLHGMAKQYHNIVR